MQSLLSRLHVAGSLFVRSGSQVSQTRRRWTPGRLFCDANHAVLVVVVVVVAATAAADQYERLREELAHKMIISSSCWQL